jgi:hypothetical protein
MDLMKFGDFKLTHRDMRWSAICAVNKKTFKAAPSGRPHLYGTKTIFSSTIAVNSLALMLGLGLGEVSVRGQ